MYITHASIEVRVTLTLMIWFNVSLEILECYSPSWIA